MLLRKKAGWHSCTSLACFDEVGGDTSLWLTFRYCPAHRASDVTDVKTGLFVLDLGRGRSATADNRLNKVKNAIFCVCVDVLGMLHERAQIKLPGESPETWNRGIIRALSVCASARAAWAVLTGLAPVLSTHDTWVFFVHFACYLVLWRMLKAVICLSQYSFFGVCRGICQPCQCTR